MLNSFKSIVGTWQRSKASLVATSSEHSVFCGNFSFTRYSIPSTSPCSYTTTRSGSCTCAYAIQYSFNATRYSSQCLHRRLNTSHRVWDQYVRHFIPFIIAKDTTQEFKCRLRRQDTNIDARNKSKQYVHLYSSDATYDLTL